MILICDDDAMVRSSLHAGSETFGYEVLSAATPEEVLEIVRRKSPRLILMDMNYTHSTTGEEGLELLAKVKILSGCTGYPDPAWGSFSWLWKVSGEGHLILSLNLE